MKLKSMKLKNFRGYQDTIVIPISPDLTGVVGKNDVGKSTIFEALAIFFEIDGIKADKKDMNCFQLKNGESTFEITCEFSDLPTSLLLDENVTTSLDDEYLLNKDNNLEIIKVFKSITTGKPDKIFIRCLHPDNDELNNLLALKISDLKKLGEKYGIENMVADKRTASHWRKAIRNRFEPLKLVEKLLEVDKDLAGVGKRVWEKIQTQLPIYALFRADRESSDNDSEAKNPLQQAVKNAQINLEQEILTLEKKIENSVLEVANRTLIKLKEMNPELANTLKPKFKEKPKWTFNFTLEGENGIPINKRGSGVRRLILLNFFRAEAEKIGENSRNIIYAIEEPETSQHPSHQVMLMKTLLALANQPNRQILITTHVPALAGLIPIGNIRYITKNQNDLPSIKEITDDEHLLKEVAESLGILPEIETSKANAVILVEGKSDIFFLNHISETLKKADFISSSLQEKKIIPIFVGGSGNMKHWVTCKFAQSLNIKVCIFMDSDIGGDPGQIKNNYKRKTEADNAKIPFYTTRKREAENYICPKLILRLTGKEVKFTDTCDAKKIISKETETSSSEVIENYWGQMTAQDILSRSAYSDHIGETQYELKNIIENILELVEG